MKNYFGIDLDIAGTLDFKSVYVAVRLRLIPLDYVVRLVDLLVQLY